MIKENDINIIEAYILWFYRRVRQCPSIDQIESFKKNNLSRIQFYLDRDFSVEEAFKRWEMDMNS